MKRDELRAKEHEEFRVDRDENSSPIKILLIEDNPGDADLIRGMLAETGRDQFELTHVERFSQAFEYLKECRFDVILLDLLLPDSTGIDTFISAHRQSPDVPIVVLAGLNDEELALQAMREGAQDYLAKGRVDGSSLARSVRYAVERKRRESLEKDNVRLEAEIAERKRAEEKLRESLAQLSKRNRYGEIISAVTRGVHQTINLQEVLENAVETMSRNIDGAHNVSIYFVEGEEAVLKAYRGYTDRFIERAGRIPYPRGFTWKTIMDGVPIYCPDVDKDTVIGPAGREAGTKSYASMPIQFEGKTVGATNINSLKKNAFDEEELGLFETVTRQIEIAINNAKRAESLEKAKDELRLRVDERTQELSGANEELKKEITKHKQTEAELQKANEELVGWVGELEENNRKMVLLNEMGDQLQSGLTADEIYDVVTEFCQKLFSDDSGGLYMLDGSQRVTECVVSWGEPIASRSAFAADECWALRRGHVHAVQNTSGGLLCGHINPQTPVSYLCAPIVVQGSALGVLYFQDNPRGLSRIQDVWGHLRTSVRRQAVLTMTEHIAMAMTNLKLRESLRDQAIRDPLTGLFNRRYMEETLERELSQAERKNTSVGMIMLDIDHFKRFNDSFGHAAGDVLLRELGVFLRRSVRTGDIACRYGGEEFLLVLLDASIENTHKRAEGLREGGKKLFVEHDGKPLKKITLSMGVACYPDNGLTVDAVLRSADAALYRAKNEGRDTVVVAGIVEQD